MIFYCAIYWFVGIFFVGGSFYPSHITNTTFYNISTKFDSTYGNIIYMNALSYRNFTMERCIFSLCLGAYYGGVLFLSSSSPSVIIISCRFQDNSASYGSDIFSESSSCFSGYTPINSCTSSTTSKSVYCNEYKSVLPSPCDVKIVCYCLGVVCYY
jgi:hypothetical protein